MARLGVCASFWCQYAAAVASGRASFPAWREVRVVLLEEDMSWMYACEIFFGTSGTKKTDKKNFNSPHRDSLQRPKTECDRLRVRTYERVML